MTASQSTTHGFVPLFSGQGTSFKSQIRPSPSTLVHACLVALEESISTCFKALNEQEISQVLGLQTAFHPSRQQHPSLAVLLYGIAESSLWPKGSALSASLQTTAFQLLRYLDMVETLSCTFEQALSPAILKIGTLGFSSGLLAATVVSHSSTFVDYISNACAAIQVAFWLGFRAEIYKQKHAGRPGSTLYDKTWAAIVINADIVDVNASLQTWQDIHTISDAEPCIPRVAAYLTPTSFTISGRPDYVASWQRTCNDRGWSFYNPRVVAAYHAGAEGKVTAATVLDDLRRTGTLFPRLSPRQPLAPVCSTVNGERLDRPTVEDLLDLIFVQESNWCAVVDALESVKADLVNIGPGAGLFKSTVEATSTAHLGHVDASNDFATLPQSFLSVRPDDIAIIGTSFALPGATDINSLWSNLIDGRNMCRPIPPSRFEIGATKMSASTGNFLDAPDSFDNAFFRISSREALSMDPQQRLLLQHGWAALENAGYVPDATPSFARDSMGVYVGVATGDYERNLSDNIDVYYSTGNLRSFLSGRLSHALQLSGPSLVVDTACSGSLTAIHLACQALTMGECKSALVGGVNVITSPQMFSGLDRAHFLSSTGQCKAWDASADGYSRAEGVALFVLKPLQSALIEGDNIMGVIKASALNQSGQSRSITQPHGPTQARLIQHLLQKAELTRHDVQYVEAHGTGTQVGDPVELEAIRSVLGSNDRNVFHVGSIKTVMGHGEAVSGSAGLIKLLAMLDRRTIPMQPLLKTLNPKIRPLGVDGCQISTVTVEWKAKRRVALLNNFGAAGSNGALLLQEAPERDKSGSSIRSAWPFSLSAATLEQTEAMRSDLKAYLNSHSADQLSLGDLSYTLMARRQAMPHVMTWSACTQEEVLEALSTATISTPVTASSQTRDVLFCFSGQGTQHAGMAVELLQHHVFSSAIEECEKLMKASDATLSINLSVDPNSKDMSIAQMQLSIFAVDYALFRLLQSWNVHPTIVAGHSLGEYIALVVAGVLQLKDAVHLLVRRAELMSSRCVVNDSGMLAVNMSLEALQPLLDRVTGVSPACINSPTDIVVAGRRSSLNELKLDTDKQAKSTLLNVPFGYHSPAMNPIEEEFVEAGKTTLFSPPTLPILSNVLGRVVAAGEEDVFDIKYLYTHCSQPVRFSEPLQAILGSRNAPALCIDIGPHPACLPMLKAAVKSHGSSDTQMMYTIKHGIPAWKSLCPLLLALRQGGWAVDWRAIYADNRVMPSLPRYPFTDNRFLVKYKQHKSQSEATAEAPHPTTLLGSRQASKEPGQAIFHTTARNIAPWSTGHIVGGHALCPASMYHALAIDAAHAMLPPSARQDTILELTNIEYVHPLVCQNDDERSIRTALSGLADIHRADTSLCTFSIASLSPGEADQPAASTKGGKVHCRGTIFCRTTKKAQSQLAQSCAALVEYVQLLTSESLSLQSGVEVISRQTIYQRIFPRVVQYAPEYQAIQRLRLCGRAALAEVQLARPQEGLAGSVTVIEPRLMDTILHAAGFVINSQANNDTAYICVETRGAMLLHTGKVKLDPYAPCQMFCFLSDGQSDAPARSGDVCIKQGGEIVAMMTAMQFKRVSLARLHTSLGKKDTSGGNSSITLNPSANAVAAPPPPMHRSSHSNFGEDKVSQPVRSLIANTCGASLDSVHSSTTLESLGIDSLMTIELLSQLHDSYPSLHIDSSLLLEATVGTIIEAIKGVAHSQPTDTAQNPFPPPDSLPNAASTLEKVRNIVSRVTGASISSIHLQTTATELGIDSLMVIELLSHLSNEWPAIQIDSDVFFDAKISDIVSAIDGSSRTPSNYMSSPASLESPHSISSTSTFPMSDEQGEEKEIIRPNSPGPVMLQMGSGNPLFLVHDGSGSHAAYSRIEKLQRPLWGFSIGRNLATDYRGGLKEMAEEYAAQIAKTTSEPVIVGGWSFGGAVAFEIARYLLAAGHCVIGCILIDTPFPIGHEGLPDEVIAAVSTTSSPGLHQRFKSSASVLVEYGKQLGSSPSSPEFLPDIPLILLRCKADVPLPHSHVDKDNSWLSRRSDSAVASIAPWARLSTGFLAQYDIDGHHFQPFKQEFISCTSAQLISACATLEEKGRVSS